MTTAAPGATRSASPTRAVGASSGPRPDHAGLTSFEDATSLVLGHCPPLEPVCRPPEGSCGHLLAAAVRSAVAVPSFDNSAMDGFAVRADSCRGSRTRLKVTDMVAAGGRAAGPLGAGRATRIMTGASLPEGADAVCPSERTTCRGDEVVIEGPVAPGDHVRRAGEDVGPGDTVIEEGRELSPVAMGVLASIGCREVLVRPRPRVGVLSTGDELAPGAAAPVRDANRVMLLSALERSGFGAEDLGTVGDDAGQLLRLLGTSPALDCQALITTGGVSVGDHDVVRLVLEGLDGEQPGWARRTADGGAADTGFARSADTGFARSADTGFGHWWLRVAIKPAKPLAFAILPAGSPTEDGQAVGARRLFGLPGNPVSALLSFELFARPALRRMAGHRTWWRPTVRATVTEDLRRRGDGKVHFVMARIVATGAGGWEAAPLRRQGSHQLSSFLGADAVLVVPPDQQLVPSGSTVDALLLDEEAALVGGSGAPERWGFDGRPLGRG